MTGARIAGPFPAENTPLRWGEKPSHSFKVERKVAEPAPPGMPTSQ